MAKDPTTMSDLDTTILKGIRAGTSTKEIFREILDRKYKTINGKTPTLPWLVSRMWFLKTKEKKTPTTSTTTTKRKISGTRATTPLIFPETFSLSVKDGRAELNIAGDATLVANWMNDFLKAS